MKKKIIIPIIFAIMLLSVSFVHAAENQFQDITDLIGDVFEMVGDIFTLDIFQEPSTAFGLLLFLFWVAIFAGIYYGLEAAFEGMNKRLKIVIALVPATMVVILMNFETDFFVSVLGAWFIPTTMLLIYVISGLVIRRLFQLEETAWAHLFRAVALIGFGLLIINLEIEKIAEFIEEVARYKAFMLPFFFKRMVDKYKKWY